MAHLLPVNSNTRARYATAAEFTALWEDELLWQESGTGAAGSARHQQTAWLSGNSVPLSNIWYYSSRVTPWFEARRLNASGMLPFVLPRPDTILMGTTASRISSDWHQHMLALSLGIPRDVLFPGSPEPPTTLDTPAVVTPAEDVTVNDVGLRFYRGARIPVMYYKPPDPPRVKPAAAGTGRKLLQLNDGSDGGSGGGPGGAGLASGVSPDDAEALQIAMLDEADAPQEDGEVLPEPQRDAGGAGTGEPAGQAPVPARQDQPEQPEAVRAPAPNTQLRRGTVSKPRPAEPATPPTRTAPLGAVARRQTSRDQGAAAEAAPAAELAPTAPRERPDFTSDAIPRHRCFKQLVVTGASGYLFGDAMTAAEFRAVALRSVGIDGQPRHTGPGMPRSLASALPPRRVLLLDRRRGRPRYLLNVAAITALLDAYGVPYTHLVDFKGSFEDQVRVYNDHGIILGVHGAGFINCGFARQGSAVIEVFPYHIKHTLYMRQAAIAGLTHLAVYETDPSQTFRKGNALKSYLDMNCDEMPSLMTQWKDNACRGPLIGSSVSAPMRPLEEALVNALDMIGYRTVYKGLHQDERMVTEDERLPLQGVLDGTGPAVRRVTRGGSGAGSGGGGGGAADSAGRRAGARAGGADGLTAESAADVQPLPVQQPAPPPPPPAAAGMTPVLAALHERVVALRQFLVRDPNVKLPPGELAKWQAEAKSLRAELNSLDEAALNLVWPPEESTDAQAQGDGGKQ
jgi:hypothetical protein